jgi:hypothetical protein
MFKLKQTATYTWPVTVSVPTDGGRYEKETFDGEFRRMAQTRLKEMQAQIEAGKMTDDAFVREVLVGWRGVTNDGEEVPFSASALDTLLDIPQVAAALVVAFAESHSGLLRKN